MKNFSKYGVRLQEHRQKVTQRDVRAYTRSTSKSAATEYKKFELMLTGCAKAYSSSSPQAVTHRSTNRARRRVTSFQPKRITNDATPSIPAPWRRLVNDFVSQSEIARKIH